MSSSNIGSFSERNHTSSWSSPVSFPLWEDLTGPELIIKWIGAKIYVHKEAQTFGTFISGTLSSYLTVAVQKDNWIECLQRTQTCKETANPLWDFQGAPAPISSLKIPKGWRMVITIMQEASFGKDVPVAECILDFDQVKQLYNGEHWLPLRFHNLPAAELLILVMNFNEEKKFDYRWNKDKFLPEFQAVQIPMTPDIDGNLSVTLIRKLCKSDSIGVILYIHDFSDYFWNAEIAEKFNEKQFDFYALDLRRYGRSRMIKKLLNDENPKTPNWTVTASEYNEDIHVAVEYLRNVEKYKGFIMCGQVLGGLIATIYVEDHSEMCDGLVLTNPLFALNSQWKENTNWFDRKDSFALPFARPYNERLHKEFEYNGGIYNWDLHLRPIDGFEIHNEFLASIQRAQSRVSTGLQIQVPILLLTSAESSEETRVGSECYEKSNVVINSKLVHEIGTKLGPDVERIEIENGIHELFLSNSSVKKNVYRKVLNFVEIIYKGKQSTSSSSDE